MVPFAENGKIRWKPRYETNGTISENDKGLMIQEDGYYFLNLQVTLKTCPCNGTSGSECVVKLKGRDRDLLLGWINAQTCSTGLLGKVEMLSQGTTLEIAQMLDIDESEILTHLDIIMLQPRGMLWHQAAAQLGNSRWGKHPASASFGLESNGIVSSQHHHYKFFDGRRNLALETNTMTLII